MVADSWEASNRIFVQLISVKTAEWGASIDSFIHYAEFRWALLKDWTPHFGCSPAAVFYHAATGIVSLGLAGCTPIPIATAPSPAPVAPCISSARPYAVPYPAGKVKSATAAISALRKGLTYRTQERADWVAAEQAFRTSLQFNPRLALAHLELADALAFTGGHPTERRHHYAIAVIELPNNPRAHSGLADTLHVTAANALALHHLRCALELKPEDRLSRRLAARLALDLEGYEAASTIMAPLLNNPEVVDWLLAADVYEAGASSLKFAEALHRAATQSNSAALHHRAALAWQRAGYTEQAKQARLRAQALRPQRQRNMRPLPDARR